MSHTTTNRKEAFNKVYEEYYWGADHLSGAGSRRSQAENSIFSLSSFTGETTVSIQNQLFFHE